MGTLKGVNTAFRQKIYIIQCSSRKPMSKTEAVKKNTVIKLEKHHFPENLPPFCFINTFQSH